MDATLSRRAFGSLTLGAGTTVAASPMAAGAVVESDVIIKTADGNCDAALFYPLGRVISNPLLPAREATTRYSSD